MFNPLAKQSDAIHMATRDLYSSFFGEIDNELINSTGFYGLLSEKIRVILCEKLGVTEFSQLSMLDRYKALATVQLRYHEIVEREDDFGRKYLYHKAFFKAFLEKAEHEEGFGIPFRYYLEMNYSPDSSFKPKQLDTWEDYQFLAEKMLDSLNYSESELTPYQRQYLADAIIWFTKQVNELQSQGSGSASTPSVHNEPAASPLPAPPPPRVPITIADLCLGPFTSADLTALLIHLKAVPDKLPHRWVEQPVSKKGAQSRIVAALSFLSQLPEKLFNDERDLWEEPVHSAYGVSLGKIAIEYEYGYKNTKTKGTQTFDNNYEKAAIWIKRWKSSTGKSQ